MDKKKLLKMKSKLETSKRIFYFQFLISSSIPLHHIQNIHAYPPAPLLRYNTKRLSPTAYFQKNSRLYSSLLFRCDSGLRANVRNHGIHVYGCPRTPIGIRYRLFTGKRHHRGLQRRNIQAGCDDQPRGIRENHRPGILQ